MKIYRAEDGRGFYVRTGEFRSPKAGEWYLSGAIPEAYYAPNDIMGEYHIMRHATVEEITCPTCGQVRQTER